jgi:uncharacterized protein YdaU (DUF1376 family)
MSGQAWYPHYARDFIDGVQGLGADTIGAYIVVLDLIYARGGPIKNDPKFISGILGCSSRLASSLITRLVDAGKLRLDGDFLANGKAEKVIEKAAKLSRNLSEAGAKGARNKAEKNSDDNKNNELEQATLKQSTAQDRTIEEDAGLTREREAEKPSLPANLDDAVPADLNEVQRLAKQCCDAAGIPMTDLGSSTQAITQIRTWLKAGADPPLILDTIEAVKARSPSRRIASLKYFNNAISDALAERKALENGTVPRNSAAPVDEVTARAAARIAARRAADPEWDLALPG